MPTPPTLSEDVIIIGDGTNAYYSTWGKTRCAVINGNPDPEGISPTFNFNAGTNSLIIEEGFYPDESHMIRVSEWPYKYSYLSEGLLYNAAAGPFSAYIYTPANTTPDPDIPQKSEISIGGYQIPDAVAYPTFAYTALENLLDENDCADFYVGRLINGTYTTDSTFCDSDPTTNPDYRQDLGNVNFNGDTNAAIGGFTSISDMTAF